MKNFFTIFCAFFVAMSFAQKSPSINVSCGGTNSGVGFNPSSVKFVDDARFNGSKSNATQTQMSSVKFETAFISFPDGSSANYLTRFNPYTNEMEIKTNDEILYLAKKKEIIVKFVNSKKEFQSRSFLDSDGNLKSGFFTRQGDSDLFSKIDYVYVPAQKAKSSYGTDKPAKMKENLSYFYKNHDNQLIRIPSNKKMIVDAFPELSHKEIKLFIKKNKIKLNKINSLLVFTDYIKTLEESKYSNVKLVKSE